jgi:hypothetical protein
MSIKYLSEKSSAVKDNALRSRFDGAKRGRLGTDTLLQASLVLIPIS